VGKSILTTNPFKKVSFADLGAVPKEKAYSYIRWSSDIQTRGDSLRRQLEMTRTICKDRGWELDEALKPQTESAFTGENLEKGSLANFIFAVREKRIATPCILVVEALDRLTRIRLRDAYRLFSNLLDMGVKICTVHNGKLYDQNSLDNPIDLLMSLMELKAAHEYSANIGRRTGATWTRKRTLDAKNAIITKSVPAWLSANRTTNQFTIDMAKANVVKRIFDDYANGKGIRTIMRELNDEKIPTFGRGKQNKGNGWSNTHLRRLLSYRGVLGEYQPHKRLSPRERIPDGDPILNYYPAIVSKATFYKVQDKISKNGHASGCKLSVTNLFTGLVKCSHCGGSMVIKQSGVKWGKYSYTLLVCSNALRNNGCSYNTIPYPNVERAILTTLWVCILPVMAERDSRQCHVEHLKAELKDIVQRQHIINDQIEMDGTCPKGIFKLLTTYEIQEKELNQQIETLSAAVENNPFAGWEQISNTVTNRLRLQSFFPDIVQSITIDAKRRKAVVNGVSGETSHLEWNKNYTNGFILDGLKQAYLDDVLVWKGDKNIPLKNIELVDAPVCFGVEFTPGVISTVV